MEDWLLAEFRERSLFLRPTNPDRKYDLMSLAKHYGRTSDPTS
jgi:hypothetical protein